MFEMKELCIPLLLLGAGLLSVLEAIAERTRRLAGDDWSSFPAAEQHAYAYARKLTKTPWALSAADYNVVEQDLGPERAMATFWWLCRGLYMTCASPTDFNFLWSVTMSSPTSSARARPRKRRRSMPPSNDVPLIDLTRKAFTQGSLSMPRMKGMIALFLAGVGLFSAMATAGPPRGGSNGATVLGFRR